MSTEYTAETLRIVETIKHLRLDCEQACLLSELLRSFDQKVDDTSWEQWSTGVRRSVVVVQKSLLSNLLLTLTRAYDDWGKKRNNDRMCLQGVFSPIKEHPQLLDAFALTQDQKQLFEEAYSKWMSLDNLYSYHIIPLKLQHTNGKITEDKFEEKRKKLALKKVFKGLRNEVLAHNLPQTELKPTIAELRSLLSHTLEIIGPLSEAFTGVSVSFESVSDVCRKQADEYWGLCMR